MKVPSSLSLFSDIDECAEETDNCAATIATCTDTEGSFTCACNIGYSGDGVSCTGKRQCSVVLRIIALIIKEINLNL